MLHSHTKEMQKSAIRQNLCRDAAGPPGQELNKELCSRGALFSLHGQPQGCQPRRDFLEEKEKKMLAFFPQNNGPLPLHQITRNPERFLRGSLKVVQRPFSPASCNPLTQQGGWHFLLFPVKYLIKPHKGANVLLKLMELYKKC